MSTPKLNNESRPKIAVMGAGAVGSYFGGLLARAGFDLTLIGRPAHVEAISKNGLLIDSINFKEHIHIASSTELAAAKDADLLLFCVKTTDTLTAAKLISPHLKPSTVFVSMQNGVDNVDLIKSETGINAVAAVVYVAVQFTAPGQLKHNGRGDLIIGYPQAANCADNTRAAEQLEALTYLFNSANVPCRISENIKGELWVKMIINCAYNAISALTRTNYSSMLSNSLIEELMISVVEESKAIAQADGVQLPDLDLLQAVLGLAKSMGSAVSSTAQDLSRGKATEIDALNGYIVRRGKILGIATPVNSTLYALVKELEQALITKPQFSNS